MKMHYTKHRYVWQPWRHPSQFCKLIFPLWENKPMQSLMVLVLALAITIQSNCTCNWIVPSLQSTEVHNEAGQSLESIGRAEEVSFEFKVKDSLSEGIADMRE